MLAERIEVAHAGHNIACTLMKVLVALFIYWHIVRKPKAYYLFIYKYLKHNISNYPKDTYYLCILWF